MIHHKGYLSFGIPSDIFSLRYDPAYEFMIVLTGSFPVGEDRFNSFLPKNTIQNNKLLPMCLEQLISTFSNLGVEFSFSSYIYIKMNRLVKKYD